MQFIRGALSGILKQLFAVIVIFILALFVDQIGPLKQLDAYVKEHPQPWTGLTIGAATAGALLLLFAFVSWGIRTARPMSEEHAREYVSTSAGRPRLRRVFRGEVYGIETPEGSASFREIKVAFRNGAWLRDPVMRGFCFGTVGLLLLTLGAFGYFIVIGPATVKVICSAALAYAFARTGYGFWKA